MFLYHHCKQHWQQPLIKHCLQEKDEYRERREEIGYQKESVLLD